MLCYYKIMPHIDRRKRVYSTPWFHLIEKNFSGAADPYYAIELPDYVSLVALTTKGDILLVRQYRPAVEKSMLELPSGHVDEGEEPEAAARRELLEETGYEAQEIELLGCLTPDTGRLSNRMWCYFAKDARLVARPSEPGIELEVMKQKEFFNSIRNAGFDHALNIAAVHLAVMNKKIGFDGA